MTGVDFGSDGQNAGDDARVAAFIEKWRRSGGSELANSQSYLGDLCEVLGVPRPIPSQSVEAKNYYGFELTVRDPYHSSNARAKRIDLYKQDAFLLEAKQGVGAQEPDFGLFGHLLTPTRPVKKGIGLRDSAKWHEKMAAARTQAQGYVAILPDGHRPPPFVIVADVGHCIELWSNFARDGKAYTQFPSRERFRIYHEPQAGRDVPTLADPDVRKLLARVWTDPEGLDPSRYAAQISREAAEVLADLAKLLEMPVDKGGGGHSPEAVAQFLMRAMFTMFAEDVGLLPGGGFVDLLDRAAHQPHAFSAWLGRLWEEMNTGVELSFVLKDAPPVRKFNGQLFSQQFVLPLRAEHITLLKKAADRDWSQVEPAIFGTLLERALSPTERHKLGAHYTPRAYVERLVNPTVIEPLRADWRKAQAEATAYEVVKRGSGLAVLERFHVALCTVRVLDPACGSGNFLYVTLDLIKRLEGEVLQAIDDLRTELGMPLRGTREGGGESVHPKQFLGIEVNPRAAVIAEAVLWIGYLQWQAKNLSSNDPELARKLRERSVLEKLGNIENRDAVLAWDGPDGKALEGVPVVEENGAFKTVWDGVGMKRHPVTGLEVPDETKRRVLYAYPNARRAEWPEVDFVVGNPPFLGTKRMRQALGDGYVDALRRAYASVVDDSADFVMYWWLNAGEQARGGKLTSFGLITTNSITQEFNRKVLSRQMAKGVRLYWAVPDHPWTDASDGAAVRVAMTCGTTQLALSAKVFHAQGGKSETGDNTVLVAAGQGGEIHPDLRVGANVAGAGPLVGNSRVSGMGVALHGAGFILEPDQAAKLAQAGPANVKPYLGGRDLLQVARVRYLVDFSFLAEEEARTANPAAFQHVFDHVRPERVQNRREAIARLWWRFGWERPLLRKALAGLPRFIGTTETAKHRVFQFIDGKILPDHMIVVVASPEAGLLGVLSSRVHCAWALAAGGRLGVGNDPRYNKNRCFDPFPFPTATPDQQSRIRDLGERLDAHRKRQQALHPDLTLTGMYNVLETLRAGQELNDKERVIHNKGLCGNLLQIHQELDAAVFDAYGWPHDLDDESILQRLVDLNAERAEEERKGLIRWLRPEFQNPQGGKAAQAGTLDLTDSEAEEDTTPVKRPKFSAKPGEALDQLQAELARAKAPRTAQELVEAFDGARGEVVELLLSSLATFGAARFVQDGGGGGWISGG